LSKEIRQKISKALMNRVHSEETKEKIKQSNIKAKAHLKGKPLSEEHRKNISKGLMNHVHSEETKQKIAQSHRGKLLSEETKKLLSEINTGENHPFFGKKHSESTIKKMSDRKMGEKNPFHGKHHTETSKRLMSEANKGIPNTPEQKRKISETKIQNFKDANPVNEAALRNAVKKGASIREIAEEFKLRRSAISTWLGHLYKTSKITEARERANNSNLDDQGW
ncbi:MAG: NUMOD3 domain-containing DNA-binding protein, partial [Promethearchaeota archaeon]